MARVFGIDVSHYQGDVNWEKVAEGKTKFAIAKATEGSTLVDPSFARNWKGIQEAGLFRGAYHYAHPGGDPETQAAFFASVVGPLGFRDLPVALDLETADHHPADYVLDWTRRFLTKADALFGQKLLVYSGQFWRDALKNPQEQFFGEHALWLPAYQAEAQVKIPASWQGWTFWQYSDGSWNQPESVPGVARCDQNWFNGDLDQLNQLCLKAAPAPEPEPPTAPPNAPPNAWPGAQFVWPRTPTVSGAAVKLWQDRMIARGFALDNDGVYGPQSRSACLAFQRDQGLVADGIVGRATWLASFAPLG
jgi:lysozyme